MSKPRRAMYVRRERFVISVDSCSSGLFSVVSRLRRSHVQHTSPNEYDRRCPYVHVDVLPTQGWSLVCLSDVDHVHIVEYDFMAAVDFHCRFPSSSHGG